MKDDCPVCGAKMGQPCVWTDWRLELPHPEFHLSRKDVDMTGDGLPEAERPIAISKKDFDAAVAGELF